MDPLVPLNMPSNALDPRSYYREHEIHHTLVILNPSAALRINSVKDLVFSEGWANARFALQLPPIRPFAGEALLPALA